MSSRGKMSLQGQSVLKYLGSSHVKWITSPHCVVFLEWPGLSLASRSAHLETDRQTWACVQPWLRRGKCCSGLLSASGTCLERLNGYVCKDQKQCVHHALSHIWPIVAPLRGLFLLLFNLILLARQGVKICINSCKHSHPLEASLKWLLMVSYLAATELGIVSMNFKINL